MSDIVIYEDGKSNVQKMHIANSDKPVKFYSLDIVSAVVEKFRTVETDEATCSKMEQV